MGAPNHSKGISSVTLVRSFSLKNFINFLTWVVENGIGEEDHILYWEFNIIINESKLVSIEPNFN